MLEEEVGLQGTIDVSRSDALDTLDEPVKDTLVRELRQIGQKLKHVLLPTGTDKSLKEWDLWGPLMLCLALAISLSWSAPDDQTSVVFAAVFVIFWCGAAVVTLNGALLGGNISFFQSVCVLGYCIFPLNVASILTHVWANLLFRSLVVAGGLLWSIRASVGFVAQFISEKRKALGLYPIFLFYVTIAWMIVIT